MGISALKNLTSSSGLSELGERLSGVNSFFNEGASALPQLKELIRRELESDPRLKDIKIKITPGLHGAYFPGKDAIAMGVVNPAVMAHEIGHAKNLRQSRVYSKILSIANNVARLNNTAAIPAMLAIRSLVKDKDTRDEILNILTGASAVIMAPGLAEELSASVDAVKHAPNKLQALKSLGPAFMHHLLSASIPIGAYQFGKHI